jgi:cardiolipin synthase
MKTELRKDIFTAPNVLSFIRILLVPVFLVLVLKEKSLAALIVFFIASATDFLDGYIARHSSQVTKLGQILDPAGDKLLMSAAFIVLTIPTLGYTNVIPIWLTAVVFGRDLVIVIGTYVIYRLTTLREVHVTFLGKLSTSCQMGVLLLVLMFNWLEISPGLLVAFYYLTLLLTVFSGIQYGLIGIRMLKKKRV